MPSTDRESKVVQKQKFHILLCIERDPKMLEHFKRQLISEMDDEDIALVQKSVDAERQ